MPQRTKKSERNKGKNEKKEEPASKMAFNLIQLVTQSFMKENFDPKMDVFSINRPPLSLKNCDIDKEASEAAKSGNVEKYCKELTQRLEQSINEAMEDVMKYVAKFNEQALAILREEEQKEELGDLAENAERPDAKFKFLPVALHDIVEQLRKLQEDREIICNCLTTAVNEYPLILQRQITEYVARVIEKVSVAAKDLLLKHEAREPDEESLASIAETGASLEVAGGKELAKSESKDDSKDLPVAEKMECEALTSNKSIAEAAMSLGDDEGDAMARCELNDNSKKSSITQRNDNQLTTTRSSIDEPQEATCSAESDGEKLEGSESDKSSANMPINGLGDEHVIPAPPPLPPVKSLYLDVATSSAEGDGEKLEGSESDKSSANMPTTDLGDEHVIPTPPPPPPVKSLYLDKVDEINESILGHRKHQVNQVKRELNFAIAKLTSEVITSYEQASALQKQNSPVLEKSIIDFLKNQETKKTFFIKEITERLHRVLRMLTPEPEVNDPNLELQNLNETVKLLHFLQSTRAIPLDKISVTAIMNEKNGVLFYLLLFVGVFLIVLALSLNGEWLALLMFVAIIFIFIVKSWQGIFSSRKRNIEVFGRVKKPVKID